MWGSGLKATARRTKVQATDKKWAMETEEQVKAATKLTQQAVVSMTTTNGVTAQTTKQTRSKQVHPQK